MSTIKKTVTLFDHGKGLDPSKGHCYEVVKTQNTLEPRIKAVMYDDAVQELINQGVTVNIERKK